MEIKLKNCNNIDSGKISIFENCLNIKCAINGAGKSTIANAIESFIRDRDNSSNELMNLKPFKYRGDINTNNPEIVGLESINQVAIFNEKYVEQYTFLPDELLKNSFDILIRDDKYEQGMKEINDLIKVISEIFKENKEIDILLKDLNDLNDCFGKSKGLSKASSIYKGLGTGNKIEHIPKGLEVYKDFIRHSENVSWLKWQMDGSNYIEISSKCPYCTESIDSKKETVLAVKDKYDSKLIEHLNKFIGVIHRLSSYFAKDTYEKIKLISQSIDGIKDEQQAYLLDIRRQVNTLIGKLWDIKSLSFQTLKDFDKVIEVISDYKIELQYISHLNSNATAEKISKINGSLDVILVKAGELQGEINKQKKHIENTIKANNAEINAFLNYAGYNYCVDIIEDSKDKYKLKLKHNDFFDDSIKDAKLHLSYGERNAFALVLFMFEVLKDNPDLVILDDPVSSFDRNKKFAIANMLFRGQNSLRGKTVLMLTHDFDPVVDITFHLRHKFQPIPKACYLENDDGIIVEKRIRKSDIKTFLEIAKTNIALLDEDINKLIYLRRLLEINNDKTSPYQLLSNLFKKRDIPRYIENEIDRVMTEEEIKEATDYISNYIPNFNYKDFYDSIMNIENLIRLYDKASNNYEKLQIYRIINVENSDNDVIRKFVNETFHIENDYIYQLNPCEYEMVPKYIINECNKDISKLRPNEMLVSQG